MMKRNVLWMTVLTVMMFTAYSCRNDYITDHNEVYNNKSKFQLTSKTISLSESKHKSKLLFEIE
ncbi:MAG: hypothetical protein LBE92_10990 [Chryseobacterium sp.]|jgi:hypothetical protein|uniref:hypothetical protein n=1 Tax=Chryseobacterium sp. TaxID=1871047 RepID=UPI002831DF10|nr:hypothetical protein [Chryseobacterium sp.]MDR2236640.1 hypothetical protein [Chryseobacterium sp.]